MTLVYLLISDVWDLVATSIINNIQKPMYDFSILKVMTV